MQHIYRFRGQEDGEEVLRVIHRHWFDLLLQFLPLIVLFLGASLILFIANRLSILDLPGSAFLFFASLCAIWLWIIASVIWVDYYLDVWIMTTRRVVNIEQRGLFLRHVSELRYHTIQDITTEVVGFFPTVLDYGEVHIQTAGTQPRFLFHNVGDPNGIKNQLISLQNRWRKKDLTSIKKVLQE
jgi:uncharacterized membrane protein YdbT with pleckstrin-like domain